MTNTIRLPQLPWEDSKELELALPENWQVNICYMAGYQQPAMTDEQIKASIANFIGSRPIRELARRKNEVVILFDDICRVTRVAKVVPL